MMTNWPVKKLGEVAEKATGVAYKSGDFTEDPKFTPVILLRDFDHPDFTEKYLKNLQFYSSNIWVEPGDILISKTSDIKLAVWKGPKSVLNQNAMRLRIKDDDLLQPIVEAFLRTKITELKSKLLGGTITFVKEGQIMGLNLTIPPLPIQKKIVENLNAIRKAQELNGLQISKTEELFKTLTGSFFPGKYKNSFPIKELVYLFQYGISKSTDTYGDGYPILRINSIKDGEITGDDIKFVQLNQDEFKKYQLDKNDVLFNRTNSFELVGKTGIFKLEGSFVFASYLIRLKTNEKVLPDLLNYFLNSEYGQSEIKKRAKRAISQANINAQELGSIKIGLPTVEEQEKIVEKLSAVQEHKKLLLKQKSLLKELFNSVLYKCMIGKL